MQLTIVRIKTPSIYKFGKKGKPKNALAKELVEQLEQKIGKNGYMIIFDLIMSSETPDLLTGEFRIIEFESINLNH